MAVTLPEALDQLNIDSDSDDLYEVQLYVDAANEWIATKVSDTSPTPVKLAALFLIDHLWQSQRGLAATPISGDEIVTVTGTGYAIPNRVRELLEPYLSTSGGTPVYSFPDAVAWPDTVEWPAS